MTIDISKIISKKVIAAIYNVTDYFLATMKLSCSASLVLLAVVCRMNECLGIETTDNTMKLTLPEPDKSNALSKIVNNEINEG